MRAQHHTRRRAPRVRAGLFVLAFSALVTGCGTDDADTPVACLGTADAYLQALQDAPGDVRLDGTTPISSCVVPSQGSGELSAVGTATVEAATRLNARARRDPAEATVQLGYLVGAVQEGASRTGGVHADLVRRLDGAARFAEAGNAPSAAFERAFGEGYAAGQDHG